MDCFLLATRGNLGMTTATHNPGLSLREFVELVAILVWGTEAVKQNSSLREPKVRGNLVILGSSLRGFEKAVAIHKKLKIEN